jgi:hypothetical protein
MQRLINFVQNTYPSKELPNGNHVHLIQRGGDYAMIVITSPEGYINMMDKYVYVAAKKGEYIRVTVGDKKHIRVYMHEFEEDI